MKKLLLSFGFVASIMLISCGSGDKSKTWEDINVSELEDACGCVDAMSIVAKEVLALMNKYDNEDELKENKEDFDKFKKLEEKFNGIDNRCDDELDIPKEEAEKCEGFEELSKIMDDIKDM